MVTFRDRLGKTTNSAFSADSAYESAEDRKWALQMGGGDIFWDATMPPPKELIPELINTELVDWKPGSDEWQTSLELLDYYAEHGDQIIPVDLYYYRTNTLVGKGRRLDNSDLLKGKRPVYGDLDTLKRCVVKLQTIQKDMHTLLDNDGSLAAKAELENLDKICFQQVKHTGYFNEPMVATDPIPDDVPDIFKVNAARVAKRYVKALKSKMPDIWNASLEELFKMDSDPQTTMTGMPTLQSGDHTHEARMATLAIMPSPNDYPDPWDWFCALSQTESEFGFQPGMMYASVASTRFGATKKPITVWAYDGPGAGYRAVATTVGWLNRVRNVFPASFIMNSVMSPMYKLLSSARQCIDGLWHSPDKMERWIKRLNSQGNLPYSIDFHGMDTHMTRPFILALIDALIEAGFPRYPLMQYRYMYENTGILMPPADGTPNTADFIKGPFIPWPSGQKVTSEFDTLYGLTVILTALDYLYPGTFKRWENDEFTLAELGDDIIFTFDKKIDADALSGYCAKTFGAYLDINEDVMFLMNIMPLAGAVPHKCRPISRLLQQTFCNEDSYEGKVGGEVPGAILRLGLMARMENITYNPFWPQLKDKVLDLLFELKYVKEADEVFRNSLLKGQPVLSDADLQAILVYGTRESHYLEDLRERAKYNAGAAYLLTVLEEKGIQVGQTPGEVAIREEYWKAYVKTPDASDFDRMNAYVAQTLFGTDVN